MRPAFLPRVASLVSEWRKGRTAESFADKVLPPYPAGMLLHVSRPVRAVLQRRALPCVSRVATTGRVAARPYSHSALDEQPPPPRRALLYMPGNDERKVRKAADLEVDCVCMDMEDAVALSAKADARETIARLLEDVDFGDSERAVRINAVDTEFVEDDLAAILECPVLPDAIVSMRWTALGTAIASPPWGPWSYCCVTPVSSCCVTPEKTRCPRCITLAGPWCPRCNPHAVLPHSAWKDQRPPAGITNGASACA